MLAVVALAVRAQTFGNPVLGFDEQFYLFVGDRMWTGAWPYVDIFDRKPVGLFLLYAAIRGLGGEGTVQYQLVAAAFATGTAYVLYTVGRRITGSAGALCAAVAYLLWLNFCEGEGGQSEVYYNLLVVAAAAQVVDVVIAGREHVAITRRGTWAMLFVGLALQIKYTVLFEGVFFGVTLLIAQYRSRPSLPRLAASALLWVGVALAPTALAWGVYALHGRGEAFAFANFASQFGRLPDSLSTMATGLAEIVGITLPLAVYAALGWRTSSSRELIFVRLWLGMAILAVFAMRSFGTPHYVLPVLVPLVLCAAPAFGRYPRSAVVMLIAAAAAGQVVLGALYERKGGRDEALAVAAAARPRSGGCLYVYDGYPALYRLTGSCLLTRFVFPGHLGTASEASRAALGVDPSVEVAQILARRPETIVIDLPLYDHGNRATWRLVRDELALNYDRALVVPTGGARWRIVYRRRGT